MMELCSEYLSLRCVWLYVLFISRTRIRVNPHSIMSWMSMIPLLEEGEKSEGEVTATGLEPRTTEFLNEHSTICRNWPNDRAVFWVFISTVDLTVCSCHVTYALQSESTLYSCFEQGVPWHSGNYRVWIHSQTRTWHDKKIQSISFLLELIYHVLSISEYILEKH